MIAILDICFGMCVLAVYAIFHFVMWCCVVGLGIYIYSLII